MGYLNPRRLQRAVVDLENIATKWGGSCIAHYHASETSYLSTMGKPSTLKDGSA
jgi:hypothetical protein